MQAVSNTQRVFSLSRTQLFSADVFWNEAHREVENCPREPDQNIGSSEIACW